jgi:hypothetical protein
MYSDVTVHANRNINSDGDGNGMKAMQTASVNTNTWEIQPTHSVSHSCMESNRGFRYLRVLSWIGR